MVPEPESSSGQGPYQGLRCGEMLDLGISKAVAQLASWPRTRLLVLVDDQALTSSFLIIAM
jgi:hypothetical protein